MRHQVGLLSRLLLRRHVNGRSKPATAPPPPPLASSAADPVSPAALDSLPSPSPAIPIPTLAVAAAHLTVAAYLVVSAPNFDTAAKSAPRRPRALACRPVAMYFFGAQNDTKPIGLTGGPMQPLPHLLFPLFLIQTVALPSPHSRRPSLAPPSCRRRSSTRTQIPAGRLSLNIPAANPAW
ncbi:hypothetical protein DAI22_08g139450 [Oryza sativa Japonica Group]|nr:hypothetical protein DAI22_08g139450 [Oryza sativa Japonica Group]